MANGTSAAVTEAARLDEIGFPEFTTKLVTDVFDSLIASSIRQTESYSELLTAVGKTLTAYVNDTHDDIAGDEVLHFLATVLPPESGSDQPTRVTAKSKLKAEEIEKLNAAVAVPDLTKPDGTPDSNQVTVTADTELSPDDVHSIVAVVAKRLAANKYRLLKEMVKLGLLRLVVENGTIQSRLTFTTYGSTFYQKNSSQYDRKSSAYSVAARSGGFLSWWLKAAASTAYTSTTVRTAKEANRDTSGSQVQIYGNVVINFKTDYLPLNA